MWMWRANDEPVGQSNIAVQPPTSGETLSSFQVIPPSLKASGKGCHVRSSTWV